MRASSDVIVIIVDDWQKEYLRELRVTNQRVLWYMKAGSDPSSWVILNHEESLQLETKYKNEIQHYR